MPREYIVPFTQKTVNDDFDLFELVAAADQALEVVEIGLFQSSDVKDDGEEILDVQWIRGNTTSGSGGDSVTPTKVSSDSGTPGFTAEVCNSTIASGGTEVFERPLSFNIRSGLRESWDDGRGMVLRPGERGVLRMLKPPADALTMSGYLYVIEGQVEV